mgnify:CR=1 FL=1
MEALTKHRWASIAILSVVLPITLLITFRLTGILPEPRETEIITLEPVSWSMERPSFLVDVDGRIAKNYSDNLASMIVSLYTVKWEENSSAAPWFGRDGLVLQTHVNATVTQGYVNSITVSYYPMDANTTFYVSKNEWELILYNATVAKIRTSGIYGTDAYVVAQASNSSCYLGMQTYWVFNDENVANHQLEVTFEIVYFNGTMYRKIVSSMYLLFWCDAGEGFETAKIVSSGAYKGSLHWLDDPEDYYSIFAEEGQMIHVQIIPSTPNKDFDLSLYDPNRELKAYSYSTGNATADVSFKTDITGLWYIRVQCVRALRGLYLLKVTVSPKEEG